MRKSILAASLMAVGLGLANPAAALCLRNRDIVSTDVPDGRVMIVKMRDGTIYHNKLQSRCNGLKFNGFVWTAHNDEVCDREQTLRVINSGEICQIGNFELQPKMPPTATPAH